MTDRGREVARNDRQRGCPEDLPEEVTDTLSVIAEISGKSIKTLFNGISLLELSDEIQTGNFGDENVALINATNTLDLVFHLWYTLR
jgi:hypothetical protein